MLNIFNFAQYFIDLGITHHVFLAFACFGISLLAQLLTIGGFDE